VNPRRPIAALALALLGLAALPRAAAAQTKSDAFAGKIPPVSGQLYRKAGRLELSLGGNLSLNDAFFTKYFGGAKLGYHLDESWSVAVHATSGFAARSGSAVVCSATTGCRDATEAELRQVPGRIRAIAGVEVAWAPVYGKLNALAEQVVNFDLSLIAGVDAIAHSEVLKARDDRSPGLVTAPGAHFGLGARLFLREWMAARLEVRDYVYAVKVPNNGSGNDWQHQLFTEIGISIFFPTRNRPIR
jgi:outer membrane beta-barrel protein